MNTKGGLGRGLDHLFNATKEPKIEEVKQSDIKTLLIDQLKAGIHQPRKSFSNDTLEELSTSIKNQGVIQPLLVRLVTSAGANNQYEIIAGERRFRAAKLANLTEIPVIIRDYSDAEAMTIALIENLQREDLNVIEEAEAYFSLKEVHKLSQEDLAEKLGKSRSGVANALRLLSLPLYIRESIIKSEISASHGRCLLSINDENEQNILFQAIISKEINVRELEKIIELWKSNGSLPNYIYADDTQKKLEKTEVYKSLAIKNIESQLKDKFYKKASIRGDENKGSIKINYKNPEELKYILDILSIE